MTTVLAARPQEGSPETAALKIPDHDRPKRSSAASFHVTAEWTVADLAEPGDAGLGECSEKLDQYGSGVVPAQ